MVTFEGKWSQGRVPLSALPMDEAFSISPEDTRLLDKRRELVRQRNARQLDAQSGRIDPIAPSKRSPVIRGCPLGA